MSIFIYPEFLNLLSKLLTFTLRKTHLMQTAGKYRPLLIKKNPIVPIQILHSSLPPLDSVILIIEHSAPNPLISKGFWR